VLAVATVVLGVGLASSACGGDGESDPITQTSSSAPETTSEPAETSAGSPATTSRATTTSSSSAASSTDEGGVLDEEDEGRQLGLDDYFNADDSVWQERRYDVADRQDVQGVGATIGSCSASGSQARGLELRLGNNFSELTFTAAQSNDSQRSDQNLVVEILANNEQRDIRSVPFNQIQDFTVDVEGVNALVIRLYLDDAVDACQGSVLGVISDAMVN
jgi:hypothetical protein